MIIIKEDIELRKILLKLGISANVKGFSFIIQAVNFIREQQIHTSMGTLYNEIAKNDNTTTYARVEKAIRNAIITSYKNNKILQQIYKNKPENAQFIYDLSFNLDIFVDVIEKGNKKIC